MSLPLVAIVGRPNVGKSTLFNTLMGKRLAIVDPTAGTTRDRVAAILRQEGRAGELVDTGGLGLVDESRLEDHINAQVDLAMDAADVVVFVVDVRDGITGLDMRVAERLRKLGKPVVLAANKADARGLEHEAAEFHRLGLGEPIPLSALHKFNTTEIRDRVFQLFMTTKATGTGVGLAVVRKILERHGGSVTLDPTVVRGTRFVLELPAASG